MRTRERAKEEGFLTLRWLVFFAEAGVLRVNAMAGRHVHYAALTRKLVRLY
jgi:hypothetical protein